ncbi:ATP-binding protein [Actinoplanes sp. Pm04-4]|uniref:ATP-binding protein n=1 Tax=Paractinoplanes pyxinae TaxID=2997416 RepID=A0ABT4BCB1_9ACTN|nr:ATP-binding protein [Actinoplanes pyxinae]MCY1144156.1 ATP-binding protein [Actinoplanes pyxinae]
MPGTDDAMSWRHDIHDGLSTLAVQGSLTQASGQVLYDVLVDVVQRRPAVLIDVSGLTIADREAMTVFTRIMAVAVQWPDVMVLVCAPATDVLPLLEADILDPRLLFGSLAAGRSAVQARVAPMTEELLPVAGAAQRARAAVMDVCRQWGEPDLIDDAMLVASELVTNAAVHAHTLITLEIRLRLCHLHIAVFDGSPAAATPRKIEPDVSGGRGLPLVDAVSVRWGSTTLPTGKVVWAALDRPPPLAA